MKLVRSILTVSGFTAGSRMFGFIRTMCMAAFLGAGASADALSLAIKFPSLFRRLFAEGAMNAAFVPLFSGLLSGENKEEARHFAEEILSILIFSLASMVLIIEVFMPQILLLILPGFQKTPDRLYYTIEYARVTFPFIFLISVATLYSGVLNSLEKFVAVSSSPMAGNIGIIVTALGLISTSFKGKPGQAFAIGVFMCGVIQLVWVMIPCYRYGMKLRLKVPQWSARIKEFFLIFGPAAAGSGVVQINLVTDMLIASYLPVGGVSYLSYADRLNQLPLSMLGTAVGTALLPLLAKQVRLKHQKGIIESQNLAMEFSLLLTIPATIGLIVLAYPLTKVLIEHFEFKAIDTLETSKTLIALSLGLPAYIFVKIFSTIFFARKNTMIPLLVAGGVMLLNLSLNLLLIGPFQHVGLAFSTALAGWINAFILGFLLVRQGELSLNERFKRFIPRLCLTSSVTVVALLLAQPYLLPFIEASFGYQVLGLALLVLGGAGVFIVTARLTQTLDMADLRFQIQAEATS